MRVETQPHALGTHRAEYAVTLHDWAVPIRLVFAQSWLPNEASTVDDLSTWDARKYIVVHVLCLRLELVVMGPLWPDESDEDPT